MNLLKILFLLLLLGNVALAQQYRYEYDDTGNRINRKYVKIKKKVNMEADSLLYNFNRRVRKGEYISRKDAVGLRHKGQLHEDEVFI